MTLIEAIKSGKPFRRPGQDWYLPFDPNKEAKYVFTNIEVLMEDWEIDETYKQRWLAWFRKFYTGDENCEYCYGVHFYPEGYIPKGEDIKRYPQLDPPEGWQPE